MAKNISPERYIELKAFLQASFDDQPHLHRAALARKAVAAGFTFNQASCAIVKMALALPTWSKDKSLNHYVTVPMCAEQHAFVKEMASKLDCSAAQFMRMMLLAGAQLVEQARARPSPANPLQSDVDNARIQSRANDANRRLANPLQDNADNACTQSRHYPNYSNSQHADQGAK